MAGSRIPDALTMRTLKYGTRPEAERDRVAALLSEAGRRGEAILLFEGRPEHPFLVRERAWAVENGRAFHLVALRRLGVKVLPDAFATAAAVAERLGRWMDARACYVVLGDEAAIRRIAERLPPGMRPPPPAPAPKKE